jgi:hypothetical protein
LAKSCMATFFVRIKKRIAIESRAAITTTIAHLFGESRQINAR